MSGGFDPYHKWLRIPPREQPANYYRLLGLELFEADLDAIECAADRLMKYVRDVATVEQRKYAREVLDELSIAKRCLLIAEHKQAYDAGLRAGKATTRVAKQAPPPPKSEPPAAAQVAPVLPKTRTLARHQPKQKQKSKSKPSRMLAIASVSVLIGVGAVGVLFFPDNSKPTKQIAKTDAKTGAKTSEVLETPEVSKQPADVGPSAVPGSEPREQRAETVVTTTPEPAAESPLPEFVTQSPSAEQPIASAAPMENETSLVAVSDSVAEAAAESSDSKELAPDNEVSVDEVGRSGERGGLLREVWTKVIGNKVEEFVQYVAEHPEPNQTETIDRFEPPEDFGDQYGQRLRGYLHPPITGTYEFSIRANAEGWLYVSTDALPENKRRVEPGTKIELAAGKVYYVEALHKESTGRDYLSIGWKLPDGSDVVPIPGEQLSVQYRIAPRHETEFVVLMPQSAESSSGVKFDLLDDGTILATDHASDSETYQLTFASDMKSITAIRLEAIPHESLPASGPGRGIGGRFALAELSVTVSDNAASDASRPMTFAAVVDGAGHDLRRIVDGDVKTFWRETGRGKQAVVTLVAGDPTPLASGGVVQIRLVQRESVGCLRVLATSAPDPRSMLVSPTNRRDETLFSLFVNLGGDDFTAPDGVRWQASKLFDNATFGHEGGRGVSEDLIANKVQGTAQRGINAFRALVPSGTYDVTLYFCEYWSTTPSSRQFAIAVEQQVVAANFDLFQAAGGFAKPHVYPIRNVPVNDGRLDIQFGETSNGASTILNAVSIQQVR
jgi:hypothetical protein